MDKRVCMGPSLPVSQKAEQAILLAFQWDFIARLTRCAGVYDTLALCQAFVEDNLICVEKQHFDTRIHIPYAHTLRV